MIDWVQQAFNYAFVFVIFILSYVFARIAIRVFKLKMKLQNMIGIVASVLAILYLLLLRS